ncbi:MAG: glycosyltransferase [Clostridiales bacterium]|nr:glycosyltransferase [Clostridiales bacterium]
MQAKQGFLFSVIIPVYNTEEYLRETIESIINQKVGFKDNIQLVLINDGSTDNSEGICLEYKEKYPNNIVYRYKENGGVSSACNMGLALAEGEYINFFGSDDIWSEDAFFYVKQFFDSKEGKTVDLVSLQLEFFGAKEGPHILNFKYKETKVVDLAEDYNYIQLMTGNCFIRREATKEMKFNEDINYMEDALFINELLLKKCRYGVLSKGVYHIRKRNDNSSLSTFVQKRSKERYLVTPVVVWDALFDMSIKARGEVMRFIQYSIMYEMQWRIGEKLPESMNEQDIILYRQLLQSALQKIEDVVIAKQKHLSFSKRALVWKLKHGENIFDNATYNKGIFYNGEQKLIRVKGEKRLIFHVVESEGNHLILKGMTDLFSLNIPFELYVIDNQGNIYYPEFSDFPCKTIYSFDNKELTKGNMFVFRLPLSHNIKYSFYLRIKQYEHIRIKPFFGKFGKFDNDSKHNYWISSDHIVKLINGRLCCYNYRRRTHFVSEIRRIFGILCNKKKDYKYLGYRFLYHLYSFFIRKEVWIISDRNEHATDNGSALFKYAAKQNNSRIKLYFVLEKQSPDYSCIKKYGRIIKPNSLRHKVLLLLADKVISAYGEDAIFRPFTGQARFVADLFNSKFIYLQHGIMQGDLSGWLNVFNKNIKLIPTTTKMEYESILSKPFGYDETIVKMLGSTRFDDLFSYKRKKVIAIMPTWRKHLAGPMDKTRRGYDYVEDFKNSDYCIFYNTLINDTRLVEALNKYGYEGDFYVHGSFEKQAIDFCGNDTIKVHHENADYERVLGESSLLVTDYSGIQFDFAYLEKPIVYSQFDDIYANNNQHSYKESFFDYYEQGFGPITHTVKETVDAIITIIKNDCKLDRQYHERTKNFFYYNDDQNCKRVYDYLIEMD